MNTGQVTQSTKKILVLGHPRGATGYTSVLLRRLGIRVGHEVMMRNGISNWRCADFKGYCLKSYGRVKFDHVIHVVRDPWKTIGSAMVKLGGQTVNIRQRFCGFGGNRNRATFEAMSYLCWHKKILSLNPDIRICAENCVEDVTHFLIEAGMLGESFDLGEIDLPRKSYNKKSRKGPTLPFARFQKEIVPPTLKDDVANFYKELLDGCITRLP